MWKFVSIILLLGACKTSAPKKGSEPSKSLGEIAADLVGESYSTTSSGDYLLVASKGQFPGDFNKTFVVLKGGSNEVVYGPENLQGEVSWHSEGEVLIKKFPERIEDKNSTEVYMEVLDVESGQKRMFNPNTIKNK